MPDWMLRLYRRGLNYWGVDWDGEISWFDKMGQYMTTTIEDYIDYWNEGG